MALAKKNDYGVGDVNFTTLMDTTDKTRVGLHKVSLTNYGTTAAPEIAAGSCIEVNGALYYADADESIGGSPSDGSVFIKIIPDGATATAEFTNTAPVWDKEKQGLYSPTGGEENHRYFEIYILKSGTSYTKYDYPYFSGASNLRFNYPVRFMSTAPVIMVSTLEVDDDVYLKGDSYNIDHASYTQQVTRSTIGTTTREFIVKRPVSGRINLTYSKIFSGQLYELGLEIKDGSNWYDYIKLVNDDSTISGNAQYGYNGLSLNPGHYRVYISTNKNTNLTATAYLNSCYGIPESETVVEADILVEV